MWKRTARWSLSDVPLEEFYDSLMGEVRGETAIHGHSDSISIDVGFLHEEIPARLDRDSKETDEHLLSYGW